MQSPCWHLPYKAMWISLKSTEVTNHWFLHKSLSFFVKSSLNSAKISTNKIYECVEPASNLNAVISYLTVKDFKYWPIAALLKQESMTVSITPNYPCLITSVELDCSWEGLSAAEEILWLRVGGGVLDGEQSWRAVVDGRVCGVWACSSSSSFLFPSQNEPGTIGQLPKPLPDNNMCKKNWFNREGKREEESDHHCGNIANCAFLRPWESHTRAGTSGHGKRGPLLPRDNMSDAEQPHSITQRGGAGSDALPLLYIKGALWQNRKSKYYNTEAKHLLNEIRWYCALHL